MTGMNMKLEQATGLVVRDHNGVLQVTLNQPETRNALSEDVVDSLFRVCAHVEGRSGDLRAVVLRGAGGVFCAGGDIKGFRQNFQDGGAAQAIAASNRRYGTLLQLIDNLPLLVVAGVEGAAMGGGVGLAAVADVVIATAGTRFSLTETTLGLPPAQIAPFVVARTGRHTARGLMLTAARLDADGAARVGLVDQVVDDVAALDAAIEKMIDGVRRCAPSANAMTKALVNATTRLDSDALLDHSAQRFAEAMLGAEAKDGVSAFLNRARPSWAQPSQESTDAGIRGGA